MARISGASGRVQLALAAVLLLATPLPVAAADPGNGTNLRADLDGRPIALVDVGKYFCEDFTSPMIHCFSRAAALEASVTTAATSGVNYVIVYEYQSYAGAYMYISQDYTVLAGIGWNDRISSFVALNSETGHFFSDWFYGGGQYGFCCNWQIPGLGSWDDTFSSVHRH
jgi:hypothetical protein